MKNRLKLLVADDHPIFLDGFCSSVSAKYPEFDIVAVAANGEEAVKKERETNPDVALLDVRMPVMDGVEAARIIKSRRPEIKIIMLTTFNEKDLITAALNAGAEGYILKETPIAEVINDIQSIWHGNVLISQSAAKNIDWGDAPPREYEPEENPETTIETEIPSEYNELTQREREVLYFILEGLQNKEIASRMGLSVGTVRNHVSRIFDILGVHNRTALVLWAFENGIKHSEGQGRA